MTRLTVSASTLAVAFLFLFVTPTHAAVSDWSKGASIFPFSTTDLASDATKQSVRDLKATGANYVAFVVPYYQSNTGSTDIAAGWNTPTDATLASAIDYAHSIGLKVALKIHIETNNGDWRANINPSNRTQWFQNFGNFAAHLGELGKAHGLEMINLGTEMVSMTAYTINPNNTQNWSNLIDRVRAVYGGKLTYDANNNNNNNDPFVNEKKFIQFWNKLDYVGLSTYYQLNGSSIQDFKNAWDYWNKNDIQPFYNQVQKPILFTEVGYRSVDNAHNEPWNSGVGGGYNPTEQNNLYEALMSYWNDYPYMQGVFWWDWRADPNGGGSGNTDYTPQNKPAEQTMTKWFTTPGAPSTTPPPPSANQSFNSTGSSNPGGVNAGGTVQLAASITPQNGTASHLLVDVEMYDKNNTKVFQQAFPDQQWASGETRTFTQNWTPTTAGTYHMTIGVFSNDWSQNYHWNDNAMTFVVGGGTTQPPPATTTPPSNPPPSNGPVSTNIWWPTNGSILQGVQPLKAMLENKDVSAYKMFWQVDGGQLNEMSNNSQDYPHKEASVDFTGWKWKGTGPYVLNFVSKDGGGAVLSQKSVSIKTQ